MSKIIGIDVSTHNGTLDWAALKKAGVAFAIIRTGYGTSHTDSEFARNMEGAIANGIPVGVYHFSYALDAAGAKREAEYVAKLLEPYKDKIALPVLFDFEYDTVSYAQKQGVTLGKTAFNAHAVAFCEAIKAAGYTPGVYYNLDYYTRMADPAKLEERLFREFGIMAQECLRPPKDTLLLDLRSGEDLVKDDEHKGPGCPEHICVNRAKALKFLDTTAKNGYNTGVN